MSKTIAMLAVSAALGAGVGFFGNSMTEPSLDIVCRNAFTGNTVYRLDADSVRKQASTSYVAGEGIAELNKEITSVSFRYNDGNVILVASPKPGKNSLICTYEQTP